MPTHHQHGRPRVFLWTGDAGSERMDLSADVIDVTVSKGLDGPTGTWQIQLLPRQGESLDSIADVRRAAKLYRTIQPNHVVSIGFDRPGGIMLGLVDSVDKVRDTAGPQVAQTLTLRGRDMGKLLVQDDLIHAAVTVDTMAEFRAKITAALGAEHPLLVDLQGAWGPMDESGVPIATGKGIKEVLDWMLDHAGTIGLPALASATGTAGRFSDVLRTGSSVTTWDTDTVYSDRPLLYQGTLWGFLWTLIDRDFYEARVDCRPSTSGQFPVPEVHLVVRPKPFDEEGAAFAPVPDRPGIAWEDIRTFVSDLSYHEIPEDRILAASLGVSDADAASLFIVTSDHDLLGNSASLAEGLYYPLVDTFTAKRFGLRSLQARLSLVQGDFAAKAGREPEDIGLVSETVRDKRNRLFNWYRPLPWYEAGSVRVVGSDDYRPGDRVFLPDELPKLGNGMGLHFYCSSVRWSWSFGQPFVCDLALQRGHNREMLDALKQAIRDDAPADNPDHYAET